MDMNICNLPGSFLGFLKGTNFAPIANAMGGPKMKPLASIPIKRKTTDVVKQETIITNELMYKNNKIIKL